MAQPSERPDTEPTPAERLVRLLEEHGLEDSLRAIVEAMEARRANDEQRHRARLELLEWMLEGQPPVTEEEIERARRECEE
jgi:hypothetical protein